MKRNPCMGGALNSLRPFPKKRERRQWRPRRAQFQDRVITVTGATTEATFETRLGNRFSLRRATHRPGTILLEPSHDGRSALADERVIGQSGRRMARLDVPTLIVSDAAAFRAWLDANRDGSEGVWLVLAKKGMTEPTSLTYAQALEEALCQGWIDGQKRSRDATTFAQRFTPRRRTSQWSKRNLRIAEELIAEGRMLPAGLAEIDQAKADGRWAAAYSGQAEASVPADLAAALSANPAAEKMFADLNGANRYAVLYRIETAKRAETRSRRIDQFVEMLARGETIHPQQRARPK